MSAVSMAGHGVTADPRRCGCGSPLYRRHKLPGNVIEKFCVASGWLVSTRSAAVPAAVLRTAADADDAPPGAALAETRPQWYGVRNG